MILKYILRSFIGLGIIIGTIFLIYFLQLRIFFPPEVAAVKHFVREMGGVWVFALCHPRNLVLGFITMSFLIGLFCWHYNRKWGVILAIYAFICYNPLSISVAAFGRIPQYMVPYYKMMMNFIE